MIRNLILFLCVFAMASCVNNNHYSTIVVDCSKDTIAVSSTDSVLIVRVVYHDTVYVSKIPSSRSVSTVKPQKTTRRERLEDMRIPQFDDE